MKILLNQISGEVFKYIETSGSKRTFRDIENHFRGDVTFKRLLIKRAINNLIKKNDLVYSYQFGNTYLELSYNKPIRIGKRVVLIPENQNLKKKESDIVIKLQKGASFGTGSHPTTRLCLKGLDYIFEKKRDFEFALDIGTGSGVLAIGASLMGTKKVYATDIHDVAASEAKKNISINGLSRDIEVSLKDPDQLDNKVSLIMANLRYPTLKKLYKTFFDITEPNSFLVLSGIRESEADEIIKIYSAFKLLKRWEESEWSGIVLKMAA
jgi:ribosomal protein L11 methyltransferase